MAETTLPYTYTDPDGTEMVVSETFKRITTIVNPDQSDFSVIRLPEGPEAVALARAVLDAAGLTDHEVHQVRSRDATGEPSVYWTPEAAAESMRERSLATLQPRWDLQPEAQAEAAEAIAALPLLPDGAEEAAGEPCRSFAFAPDAPHVDVYCEHPDGDGHTGDHYARDAGLTWGTAAVSAPTDFRVRLVSELLGEDRQDAADLLAEDPAATWEKAYAVWSLESAELERYRRGESPVLDRVAQLERDMGRAEQRLGERESADTGRALALRGLTARLDVLELAAREAAQSGGAEHVTVTGGGFTESTDI